jgi:hypothetical protein
VATKYGLRLRSRRRPGGRFSALVCRANLACRACVCAVYARLKRSDACLLSLVGHGGGGCVAGKLVLLKGEDGKLKIYEGGAKSDFINGRGAVCRTYFAQSHLSIPLA